MEPELDLHAVAERFRETYALAPRDATAVHELLDLCEPRPIPEGEVLFREREQGAKAFFLLRGSVGVFRRDALGASLQVSTLEAPTLLGHMSLVDDSPRSATCTAASPCVVASMSRALFLELVTSGGARGAALRRIMIAAMSDQLAGANNRILMLINPLAALPVDDESTEHGIEEASDVLQGWKS